MNTDRINRDDYIFRVIPITKEQNKNSWKNEPEFSKVLYFLKLVVFARPSMGVLQGCHSNVEFVGKQ